MPETPMLPAMAAAPRRRWRKWRLILLAFIVLIVLPAAAVTGLFFYNRHQAQLALDEAIAETDRLDPGWRLEDIEKRRTAVPPEQNAAVHINAAAALIPIPPFIGMKDEELLGNAEDFPQCQIDAELADTLRKALEPLLPAEALARKAVPVKTGWYPIQWTPDGVIVEHVHEVRKVGWFLKNLAMLRSQDGKHDEAWQTSLTIVAVGRSFGEEPFLISALVRMSLRSMAVNSLERCLAQGKEDDNLLAEAQRQLTDESKEPVFLYALRGERAVINTMMNNLETGKIRLDEIPGKMGSLSVPQLWPYHLGGGFHSDHTWMLRYHNEAVEYTKLPPTEMRAKLAELDRKNLEAPPLAKFLTAALPRGGNAAVRSQVLLECVVAGIGVERFRLAHGRWPDSLDEVVAAKLLDKAPTDHFDGKPLRYRKASDGVVIYSIGQYGNYAGDALDQGKAFPTDPGFTRVEFRLWDEKHRRQPPRPRPKIDDEKDGSSG